MKSLANRLVLIGFNSTNPELFEEIKKFETSHYMMGNVLKNVQEHNGKIHYELHQLKEDDLKALVDISKKLSITLKGLGEDEMIKEIMLMRAKIMDHFTLAYLAEMELPPSQIKLVQCVNANGEIEMYFEKHSNIILPGDIKL